MMKHSYASPALFALALVSCSAGQPGLQGAPIPEHSAQQSDHDRLAFVQAACGGCHAVEPPGLSPNPQAPTFEAIANREGLSEQTLAAWLTDAHNYPEVMDFDLEPQHVEWVAEHMLTLRRASYTPPPS